MATTKHDREAAAERQRRRRRRLAEQADAAPQAPLVRADGQPPQFRTIEEYDAIVGAPSDWQAAKAREGVRGELISNQSRQVELERTRLTYERERGKLLPIDVVADREARADDIMRRHLMSAAELAAELATPDQIPRARKLIQAWIAKVSAAIADEIADA